MFKWGSKTGMKIEKRKFIRSGIPTFKNIVIKPQGVYLFGGGI